VNATGQVVLQHREESASAALSLQSVPSGLYFLRITASGQQAVRKVVVW